MMKSQVMLQVADCRIVRDEWEVPRVGPTEALMQVEVCGICGSDVEIYKGHFAAAGLLQYPLIPGHEPIGRIVELGLEAAKRWKVKVGDRIALEPSLSCGRCETCLSGHYNNCRSLMPPGVLSGYGFTPTNVGHGLWGGYSQFMHLHERTIFHRVPDSMPLNVASLYQPLSAGVRWAIQVPELRLGDSILILGCGQRGLGAVAAAKSAGAGLIIVTDTRRGQAKLDLAKSLGADHTIVIDDTPIIDFAKEVTGGRGVDIVVDTVPMLTSSIAEAVECCRVGGKVVLAGIKDAAQPVRLNANIIVNNEITIRGVMAQHNEAYVEAFRLLSHMGPELAALHTHEFRLTDVEEAIQIMAKDKASPVEPISITLHPDASTMTTQG